VEHFSCRVVSLECRLFSFIQPHLLYHRRRKRSIAAWQTQEGRLPHCGIVCRLGVPVARPAAPIVGYVENFSNCGFQWSFASFYLYNQGPRHPRHTPAAGHRWTTAAPPLDN
jgi:hypothetical protein